MALGVPILKHFRVLMVSADICLLLSLRFFCTGGEAGRERILWFDIYLAHR